MTTRHKLGARETNVDRPTDVAHGIAFGRLPDVSTAEIIAHMSDPRMAEHMPLLTFNWNEQAVAGFVAAKEECWRRDGLGHWAIFNDGAYVGWGGFQKEGDEWDFGLVLKPAEFGLGMRIAKLAIEFAEGDDRIPYVTFLLPLSRTRLGGLTRLGAILIGVIDYGGASFRKYRLDTECALDKAAPGLKAPPDVERGQCL